MDEWRNGWVDEWQKTKSWDTCSSALLFFHPSIHPIIHSSTFVLHRLLEQVAAKLLEACLVDPLDTVIDGRIFQAQMNLAL